MTKANTLSKKTKSFSLLKNIALFLIIFTAILAWKQRNMATGDAPAFQTTLINGEPVSLSSYRGKPLMLHFWASWCPICKFEEGSVSDLNNNKDLPLLTVAFKSGNPADVKKFMLQQHIETWPVVVDQEGVLAKQYGVNGVPATFFIDSSGQIRFKTMGLTSKWGMKIRLWLTNHL